MKRSELKQLIKEVVQEMSRRGRYSATKDVDISTAVDIDMSKLENIPLATDISKLGHWVEPDVPVDVSATGEYDDASFSYEYGSERGIYDPGSGYEIAEMTITISADTPLTDENGNDTGQILFKKGTVIPESAIKNISRLYDEVNDRLNERD